MLVWVDDDFASTKRIGIQEDGWVTRSKRLTKKARNKILGLTSGSENKGYEKIQQDMSNAKGYLK